VLDGLAAQRTPPTNEHSACGRYVCTSRRQPVRRDDTLAVYRSNSSGNFLALTLEGRPTRDASPDHSVSRVSSLELRVPQNSPIGRYDTVIKMSKCRNSVSKIDFRVSVLVFAVCAYIFLQQRCFMALHILRYSIAVFFIFFYLYVGYIYH